MNQVAQQQQEIEIDINQAREAIADLDCLRRLEDNKDFQQLISTGFLETEAIRAVGLKSEPQLFMGEGGKERMLMVDNLITSIGGLRQYFIKIASMGNTAAQSMVAYEETQEELSAEALGVSEV